MQRAVPVINTERFKPSVKRNHVPSHAPAYQYRGMSGSTMSAQASMPPRML